MDSPHGHRFRTHIARGDVVSAVGVYDVFSATLAARRFDTLFLSGFGFAASYYGLPDLGFIAWSDMAAFLGRMRAVLPEHHLLVDIDDGYGDPDVAAHVVATLERLGASGVVLEDQKRPRKCGHFDGKQIMELDDYLVKLERVLDTRRHLVVVARTDASDAGEIVRRAEAFAEAGADAILADGLRDLEVLSALAHRLGRPLCFNQIAGGKSPPATLRELRALGVSLVIYSTPCLFAAQTAIEEVMAALERYDGALPPGSIGVQECTRVLTENVARRDTR
jgi:2-methylisocitrate lyase-like PEP mutase family enzyme